MDRNGLLGVNGEKIVVVPRKGDVDRNVAVLRPGYGKTKSSPARGTWIEIL